MEGRHKKIYLEQIAKPPKHKSRKYDCMIEQLNECGKQLTQAMDIHMQEKFFKYKNLQLQVSKLAEQAIFESGFRSGIQLMIDSFELDKQGAE